MAGVIQTGSGSAGLKSQSGAGVGVEYIFKCTTDDRSAPPSEHARDGICAKELDRRCNWSRKLMKYEWAVFRSKTGTVWSAFSSPVLREKFDRK